MRRDMFRPLPICLLGVTLLCDPALGSLTNLLARAVARPVALTNAPIVVTATFINLEPTALRGFCYVDELPSALSVTPLDVQINGQSVTNYTFESGLSGDVYAGHTPWRWVLELPSNFPETNPIPAQACVQITYAVQTPLPGTLTFQPAAWIANASGTTNAIFGFETNSSTLSISFVTTLTNAPLQLGLTNGRVRLTFLSESNVTYRVEYTEDLGADYWSELARVTGTGGMLWIEDSLPNRPARFYRTRVP